MIFQIKAKYVIIDTEYPGHNREIKSFINQIIAMYNHLSCTIYFERIGKKSRAHLQGYKAYKTNQREIAVSSEEVLRLYNKVNKGQ